LLSAPFRICGLAAFAGAVAQPALAQSASPGATLVEEVVATAPEPLARRLAALPGGAALVTADDMPATANLTLSRALAAAPGVVVQELFGANDQPRVQIRGSGLQQSPVERGVLMLRDGLPINRADGSYIVGFGDPAQAEAIEIYRGYTANRLGATVLGGALNFISPTGRSAPGGELALSGGSFGQFGASAQYGVADRAWDAQLVADATRRDGYRDFNASSRRNVGLNVGVMLTDHVAVRFFADYADLGFDVPGPLTKRGLEHTPTAVFAGPVVTQAGVRFPGPNVVRDRPRRDADQLLLGSRAQADFGPHLLDVALGYSRTNDSFLFPISTGLRTTDGHDITGVVRYAYKPDATQALPLFEATALHVGGTADRGNDLNLAGTIGTQFGANKLDSTTLSLNAGFNVPVTEALTISPAISYARATRDNRDVYGLPTRPTAAFDPVHPTVALPAGAVPTLATSYARRYDGWSPSLGVSWRPDARQTLFAAVSRGFEPPTQDDLIAPVNGTPNSSPGRPNPSNPTLAAAAFATPDLAAQRATTVEAGWRGHAGAVSWDAVAYYSWITNELLSLRDASGAPLSAVNAPRTRHIGLELGVAAQLTPQLNSRVVYTYQDFRFRNDPVRGDNRLAGAPPHLVYATLDYRFTERWTAQAALRWVPVKMAVDNLNTVYADPYATVDLRSEYRISGALSVFGEVTNLFDKTYAASVVIVDQARRDQASFVPGDGRAAYGGVTLRF
jgi:iron complex outermembrane receptor protein